MKLKANHNLLLPDGKTEVKQDDIFEYEGDISSFASVVSVIAEGEKKEPKKTEEATEEKALREKARLLGIKNYHVKGIKKLEAEIAEKEAEAADQTPAPTPASTPAHVEDANPDKKEEGKADV